jgi:hypothetical protein
MKKRLLILLLVLAVCVGCREARPGEAHTISDITLLERGIDITQTTRVREFVTGCDFSRNEVYVESEPKDRNRIVIHIIDIDTGAVKREVALSRGSSQSPTDFYNPSYMQFLDGRYYIVDQVEKIVVFDQEFNHLYTAMFRHFRHFIDFFKTDGRVFFAIGKWMPYIQYKSTHIEWHEIRENRKPVLLERIQSIDLKNWRYVYNNKGKFYHKGVLWPSTDGFVKDGSLFYTSMDRRRYDVYDLKTRKTTGIQLSYLTPKTYSKEEAARFGFYKTDGWEERFFQQQKKKIVYVPYPDPIYHFGIHDVGKNKIGIVGDVDLKEMKFRLDIIDIISHAYRESIWFPFSVGFEIKMSDNNRGFVNHYIDVDRGIYVWEDIEGEDFDYVTKITTFKIKVKDEG